MTINPSLLEWFPRLTPGDSGMRCMITLRTLEVRPSTSLPTVQSLCRWWLLWSHSFLHTFILIHQITLYKQPKRKSQNSPNMMHSTSSPLPVLLLSNVVGDIHEGCYLLLWAGLLRRPSHLTQYLENKQTNKKDSRYVQQKLQPYRATLPFLITMTINPSLLERLPRLIPDDSSTWCMMICSSQTMEVRPSTSFPTVQSAQMMVIVKWYIHSHIHSHSPIHTLKTVSYTHLTLPTRRCV